MSAFSSLSQADRNTTLKMLIDVYGGSAPVVAPAPVVATAAAPAAKKEKAPKKVKTEEEKAAASERKESQDQMVDVLIDDFKECEQIKYEDFHAKITEYEPSLLEKGNGKQMNVMWQKLVAKKCGITFSKALTVASQWKVASAAPAPAPAPAPKPLTAAQRIAAARTVAAAPKPAPVPVQEEPSDDLIIFEQNGKKYIRTTEENYAFEVDEDGNPGEPVGYWDPITGKFDDSREPPSVFTA